MSRKNFEQELLNEIGDIRNPHGLLVQNIFCKTGPGGGVDPSCKADEGDPAAGRAIDLEPPSGPPRIGPMSWIGWLTSVASIVSLTSGNPIPAIGMAAWAGWDMLVTHYNRGTPPAHAASLVLKAKGKR